MTNGPFYIFLFIKHQGELDLSTGSGGMDVGSIVGSIAGGGVGGGVLLAIAGAIKKAMSK